MLRIRVVEIEVAILNVLRDTVDLELRVVDVSVWIRNCDDIDLAILRLFLKKRPFTHADADAHLRAAHVIKSGFHLLSLLVDQDVEVYVDVAPHGLVQRVLVQLGLFLFLVVTAALRPGRLHLLDIVDHIARARLVVLLHSY